MKNSDRTPFKNQQLLAENGFVFDPFNNFPIDINLSRVEEFEKKSYRELFNLLKVTKDSTKRLLPEQQIERDEITMALFNNITTAEVDPIPVDAPLLAKGDIVEVKRLEDRKLNPTFHKPIANEFFQVIPSRYQRRARQLLLLTGHYSQVNRTTYVAVCAAQGETLELEAYQFLDSLQVPLEQAA